MMKMLNNKHIFALVTSILLTANTLVGPLSIIYLSVTYLTVDFRKTILILPVLILWILFYVSVRLVIEIRLLRNPLVFSIIILLLMIPVVLGVIVVKYHNYVSGALYVGTPILLIVTILYASYLCIKRFIGADKRYFAATIWFSLFFLTLIFVKNTVTIYLDCSYDSLPYYRARTLSIEDLLGIFTKTKCININQLELTGPSLGS